MEKIRLPHDVNAKHCPLCYVPVIKSEGCNDMICPDCGHYFDYKEAQKVKKLRKPRAPKK